MSFYLVGIDEAGYGPQLGPFVVSAAVFKLPDDMLDRRGRFPGVACLWKKTHRVISSGRSRDKISVCDSKRLYNPARGLASLEKTALVFKRLVEPNYQSYGGLKLPLFADAGEINESASALRSEIEGRRIEFVDTVVSVVEPADFNAGIRRLNNKADLLWEVSARLIKDCLNRHVGANPAVIRAGKQGGRNYYLSGLQGLFMGRPVRPVEEGFNQSLYLIGSGPRPGLAVSFIRDGDATEFVIALASIFSKYYRELGMFKLNGFFRSRIQDVKPTSGYYPDSRRFIRTVSPFLGRFKIKVDDFIRIK